MKPPPYLLGATLIFWGWHVGLLPVATVMALFIESVQWVQWRWRVSEKEINRISDLSSIGLVIVIVYQFNTHSFHAVYSVLELLPTVMFTLVAVQRYSIENNVRLSTVFLSMRRADARGYLSDNHSVELGYPFIVVCLLAASAGQMRSPWFFVGAFLIIAIALFGMRPKYRSTVLWIFLLGLIFATSYGGHRMVIKLRSIVEPAFVAWFQNVLWSDRNPFLGRTAIGDISTLKHSERIVLRVSPGRVGHYPTLLRDAVYQTFNLNTWSSKTDTFEHMDSSGEGDVWPLTYGKMPGSEVTISSYLTNGKGLISVPTGTFRLEQLRVADLGRNPLGVLQTKDGPGLIRYMARYNPAASYGAMPDRHDLHLPSRYRDLFEEVVGAFDLGEVPDRVAISAVRGFFVNEFEYSLQRLSGHTVSLRDFLTRSRSGHCEYFATATVLMLRALGIPARYVTGYSVQEYSALERSFVVRRRHAHSWALAYVDGEWVDFDTTPPIWSESESEHTPWWSTLYDFWSWSGFQISRWRWNDANQTSNHGYLGWLLVPLAVILGWRLSRQHRIRFKKQPIGVVSTQPGADSAFYHIEKNLLGAGLQRLPGETTKQWLLRWAHKGQLPGAEALIGEIVPLHYRYRFDPEGLDANLRNRLGRQTDQWLALHRLSRN